MMETHVLLHHCLSLHLRGCNPIATRAADLLTAERQRQNRAAGGLTTCSPFQFLLHTGNLLLVTKGSVMERTTGNESTVPMIGMLRRNPRAVGKKSPNRFMNPQPSTMMPTIAHPYSTKQMPPRKHAVPLAFRFWK